MFNLPTTANAPFRPSELRGTIAIPWTGPAWKKILRFTGAATFLAYKQALTDGRIRKTDRVVLFNCATGLKYPMPPVTRTLDRHQPIDYAKL
jgi:hypothetical protein